ncbi:MULTISPECIES: hypothetical protein [Vagococcus]|uniref:Lipoprotein n=1 Tax=Vagococcus fluvialis bH819 TaxID=1255619 RepID=A0A1X6WRD7_9ENTE|nr:MULTISPECIES: hypothetical protein [Vagococcus]SLM86819.1 hypothetical protein FM121_12030 [Vagococcus fluvialis bH819]HCM88723.1 hypothetical protein [Vagococcus sp.]
MNKRNIIFLLALTVVLSACSSNQPKNDLGVNQSSSKKTEESNENGNRLKISDLAGNWQSQHEPEKYYLSIEKKSSDSIEYADNLEGKEPQLLQLESISQDVISALSEDKETRFTFTFSAENTITASFGVNEAFFSDKKQEDRPVGLSKPIEYKKIID